MTKTDEGYVLVSIYEGEEESTEKEEKKAEPEKVEPEPKPAAKPWMKVAFNFLSIMHLRGLG